MNFDVQNIWQEGVLKGGRDFDGLGLCFAGIVIVFTSLVLISLFITALPKLLEQLDHIFPPPPEAHDPATTAAGSVTASSDETEKVAAIAYALRQQKGG